MFRILSLTSFRVTCKQPLRLGKSKVGDRPQGVAGDCNSLAETHAWFDSKVAHHFHSKYFSLKFFLNRSLDIISLILFTDFLVTFFSNKIFILYPLRYLIFFAMRKVPFIRINIFSVMTDSIKRYNFKNNMG